MPSKTTDVAAAESRDVVTARGQGSLGETVSDISKDFSDLVGAHIAQAKAEVVAEVKSGAVAAGLAAAAGALGVVIFLFFSVFLAEGLIALFAPRWLGYLIVVLVYAVIAGVLLLVAKKKLKTVGKPEITTATVKDTVAWAKKPTDAPAASGRG